MIKIYHFKVLDKGFIRLHNFVGGDAAVIDAARVSFGGASKGEEADKKLIKYLLKHKHGTPFEHAVFTFHVKCPMFVMRQWIRHRMSSYNEISYRYTSVDEDFYIPTTWRSQDQKNKQSSSHDGFSRDFIQDKARDTLVSHCDEALVLYKSLIGSGVAREMARMVLPINLYTQFYWTVNARALMHFIDLRADKNAQWEIQQYANVLCNIFQDKMPWTVEAFKKLQEKE